MRQYIRNYVHGGTYFLTICLEDRKSSLLTDNIDAVRAALKYVKQRHAFDLPAIVILPEHLHMLIRLPENDCDFSTRIMLFKQYFSKQIPKTQNNTISRLKKGERMIWQRRFYEHTIRDERDYENCMNYIHINPYKHGYVQRPSDWQYSSLPRYIEQGIYPPDWCCDDDFAFLEQYERE